MVNRQSDSEPVSGGDLYGTPAEMIVMGILRGGYYRDDWFYTIDGTGAFRVPSSKSILKPLNPLDDHRSQMRLEL